MDGFFSRLFKKRENDIPPQVSELHDQIKGMPPEVRAALTIAPQIDIISGASGSFGYDKTNPIPVCQQEGELDYLACLRCECGEPFMFHRVGSCGSGPDMHVIDHYELLCRTRRHHIMLYMDMYHAGPSSQVPKYLTKGVPKGIGLPIHVEDFPNGLLRTIENLMNSRRK